MVIKNAEYVWDVVTFHPTFSGVDADLPSGFHPRAAATPFR